MPGHKNLIGGIEESGLGALLDLVHTKEAGGKDDEQCGADSRDDDRAPTSLDLVQGKNQKLPKWGLEKKGQS